MSRDRYIVPFLTGELVLGERTLVMAIVNVTPDSFADGGERFDPDIAIADAARMVRDGADILDVGGESTRPGATRPLVTDELARVVPVQVSPHGKGISNVVIGWAVGFFEVSARVVTSSPS